MFCLDQPLEGGMRCGGGGWDENPLYSLEHYGKGKEGNPLAGGC